MCLGRREDEERRIRIWYERVMMMTMEAEQQHYSTQQGLLQEKR